MLSGEKLPVARSSGLEVAGRGMSAAAVEVQPLDPAAVGRVPSRGLASSWKMIGVLTLFATLAAIDKNFLSLVVPDMKARFGVTDVQVGLLIGIAFAVSNVTVGLPAGWLADRANRRIVVTAGVLTWSVMAASCGLARSFGQLFLARVGVGMGEGISPPASYSLIRDGVAADRHGLAYAIFSIGGAVGSGLAFLIGSVLIAGLRSIDLSAVPLLADTPPWQLALVLIGAAGLPLAALAFAFPDPGRGDRASERADLRETWVTAQRRWRVLAPLLVFSVVQAALTAGLSAWVPALLQRTFHVDVASFGPTLGIVLIVGAPTGLVAAGLLIDRLGRNGPALAAITASCCMIVAGIVGPHVLRIGLYWPWQALIIMASTVYHPVTSTTVARVMPAASIGVTMAAFLFVQGLAGAGLGPLVVALLTERAFSGSPHAINSAITAASLLLGGTALLSAIGLLIGTRRLQEIKR